MEYKLSDIADNEMKQFAMYTIESRAIPNMIDGLKPVNRFYLYSSIVNSNKDFKKVSAVSGVVSDLGYNHGETSAASAGQLMAATWSNNVVLIEGRGSFGTRQVQEAGAARYVYTRLHANFNKYIKDINLAPVHEDPEHVPPAFYVPVIPLLLANGSRGIATGFATNILPRAEQDIIDACREYIKEGRIKKRLNVSFPDFTGTTTYDPENKRFTCIGTYNRLKPTRLEITEIPYGFDREGYIKVLDKLEEDGHINTFEDQCSASGFKFLIKLNNKQAKLITDEKINKLFKLEKAFSENITVIDQNGKLRQYDDERYLIQDFVDFRTTILTKRISSEIESLTEKARWLKVKEEFILGFLEESIVFRGCTKSAIYKQILHCTSAVKEDLDRLMKINMLSLTKEMVTQLSRQVKDTQEQIKYWEGTSAQDQFLEDLKDL